MNDKLARGSAPVLSADEEYNRRFGQSFAELTRGSEYGNLYDLSRRGMPQFNAEGLGSFDYGADAESSIMGVLDGEEEHPLIKAMRARPSEQQVDSALRNFSGREQISPEIDLNYHDAALAFYSVKVLGLDLSATNPELHTLISSGRLQDLLEAGGGAEARVRNVRFEAELKRVQGSAMLKASQLDLALTNGADFEGINGKLEDLFSKRSWDALSTEEQSRLSRLKEVFEKRDSTGMGEVLRELNALKVNDETNKTIVEVFSEVERKKQSATIRTDILYPALNSIENSVESLVIQALYAKSSNEPRSLMHNLEAQLQLHTLSEFGESKERAVKFSPGQMPEILSQLREGFNPARAALQYARVLDVIEKNVGRDGSAIGLGEMIGGGAGLLLAINSLSGAERNYFATNGVAQPTWNPLKWKPGVLLGAGALTVLGMGIGREIQARQVPIEAWGELERLTYGLTPEQQQQVRNHYDSMSKPRTEKNGGEALAIKEMQRHISEAGSDFRESLKGLLPSDDLKSLQEGVYTKELSSRMIRALASAPGLHEVLDDVDELISDGTLEDAEIVLLVEASSHSPALKPYVELMVLAEAAQRASNIHTDYSSEGLRGLLDVEKRSQEHSLPLKGNKANPGADDVVQFLYDQFTRVPSPETPLETLKNENQRLLAQFSNFVNSETKLEGGTRSAREYIVQELEKRLEEKARLAGGEPKSFSSFASSCTGMEESAVNDLLSAQFEAKEVATTFWSVASSMELPLANGKLTLEQAFFEDQAMKEVAKGLFGDPDAPFNPEDTNPFNRMTLSRGQLERVIEAIGEVTRRERRFDSDMKRNLRHFGTGNSDIPETVYGNIHQQFEDPPGWHDRFFRDRTNNKFIYSQDTAGLVDRAAPDVAFRAPTEAELIMATNPAKREFLERIGRAVSFTITVSSELLNMLEAEREKKLKEIYPHIGG